MHEAKHFPQNLALLKQEKNSRQQFSRIKQKMDSQLEKVHGLCTLCDKCLPCPENINIPEILRFRNLLEGYDMVDYGRFRYNMLEGQGHWFPCTFSFPSTECGDCLPRCPENLSIPKLLFETHDKLFDRQKYFVGKIKKALISILKCLKIWK